jgi:hypothetical protein
MTRPPDRILPLAAVVPPRTESPLTTVASLATVFTTATLLASGAAAQENVREQIRKVRSQYYRRPCSLRPIHGWGESCGGLDIDLLGQQHRSAS